MNDEQDRPYLCNAPGCSQRFHSEEHLMIHRHKHEMTLKFPSIKADNASTDQTPTPTRFLRNCDAVGLFKEIEEEFLQAQQEENNKLQQHLKPQHQLPPEPRQSQPSLHHPHTQPLSHPQGHGHLMAPSCSLAAHKAAPSLQPGSVIAQARGGLMHSGPVPGLPSSLLHPRSRQRQPLPASMPGTLPDPAMQGASAQHLPMERQMSSMLGLAGHGNRAPCSSPQRGKPTLSHHHHHPNQPQHHGMTPVGHMMDVMSQRQPQMPPHHPHHHHLPAAPLPYQPRCHGALPLQHPLGAAGTGGHQLRQPGNAPHSQPHHSPLSHLHHGPLPQHGSPLSIASELSPGSQQLHSPQPCLPQHALQQSGGCGGGGGRRRRTTEHDPDERRQKFLERNRAAATRCRQKRKVWVSSLEKKAEELTHTNLQLQNEVTSLRSEVGQLKQILLTHKDCPVTTHQRETQGYANAGLSPGGSPALACPGSHRGAVQHNSISTSSSTTTAGGDTGHDHHPGR